MQAAEISYRPAMKTVLFAVASLALVVVNRGMANGFDAAQINVQNGCVIEATIFKATHKGDAGIIMLDWRGAQHAFVAYAKDGQLWSHCTLLGDVSLGISAGKLADSNAVTRAYRAKLTDKIARVERGDSWPVADSRAGDTPALQTVRVARALSAAKVQNAFMALTRPSGEKVYAVVFAWASGVGIYSPECGTIFPGTKEFTQATAQKFAQEHLGFTPNRITYESPDGLDRGMVARVN